MQLKLNFNGYLRDLYKYMLIIKKINLINTEKFLGWDVRFKDGRPCVPTTLMQTKPTVKIDPFTFIL